MKYNTYLFETWRECRKNDMVFENVSKSIHNPKKSRENSGLKLKKMEFFSFSYITKKRVIEKRLKEYFIKNQTQGFNYLYK